MGLPEPGTAPFQAELAQVAGWDGITFVDSQNLVGDPFVAVALAARATDRLRLRDRGHQRLHPPPGGAGDRRGDGAGGVGRALRARHRPRRHRALPPRPPAHAGGRVRGAGPGPAGVPRRRRRSTATARRAGSGGSTVPGNRRSRSTSPRPGPRMLELAGGIAEQVTLAVGADPERVAWALGLARDAADGRRPRPGVDLVRHVRERRLPSRRRRRPRADRRRRRRVRALLRDAGVHRRGARGRRPRGGRRGRSPVRQQPPSRQHRRAHRRAAPGVRRPVRRSSVRRRSWSSASTRSARWASTGSSSPARASAPTATTRAPPAPSSPRRSCPRCAPEGARHDRARPDHPRRHRDRRHRRPGPDRRRRRDRRRRHGGRPGRRRRDARRRRRRAAGHARLRRHPHALRRAGVVGRADGAVGLARRHHGGERQLRCRLRAGASGRPRPADRADGGRRGHPRHRAARRALVGLADLRRVHGRARDAGVRRRRRGAGAARRACACTSWASGAREREPATDADIAEMAALARDAIEQGALGFTTSRTLEPPYEPRRADARRSPRAPTSSSASRGRSARPGRGVLQVVSDFGDVDAEFAIFRRMAEESGRPLSFSLVQTRGDAWRRQLALLSDATAAGVEMRAQVAPRAVGLLLGLQCTLHPLLTNPVYREIAELPLAERVAILERPETKARVLAADADAGPGAALGGRLLHAFGRMFELADPPDYEPDPATSVAARAERERSRRARPRVRPAPRRRRPGDALPAEPQLGRRQPRRRPARCSPIPTRSSGSATAARTSGRSATPASRPRSWPGGVATVRAAGSTCRCSCAATRPRRPPRSGSPTGACSRPATAPT